MEEFLTKLDAIYHEMNDLRLVKRNYYPLKRLTKKMLSVLNEKQAQEEDADKRQELLST